LVIALSANFDVANRSFMNLTLGQTELLKPDKAAVQNPVNPKPLAQLCHPQPPRQKQARDSWGTAMGTGRTPHEYAVTTAAICNLSGVAITDRSRAKHGTCIWCTAQA
jgi:hypothetical protein